MTIEVRQAREDEYERVGALTEAGYRHDGYLDGNDSGYDAHLRDAAARATGAELLVAVEGDALLGTTTWCPVGSDYREVATTEDQGEFRMLSVDPVARRRGVGRILVAACIERARRAGLTEIVMCSMRQMTPAHRMYESMGFVRMPEADWAPVPGVDLLAYRLPLARPR